MSWFSVKTVLFDLRLIKCNTKFVFFCLFLLYFFVTVRYLSLKKKDFLKKKNAQHSLCLDQWFFVNVMLKLRGKRKLRKHLLVFPLQFSRVGWKSPNADTENVGVIWRLSPIPLTRTFLAPLMFKRYFPGET